MNLLFTNLLQFCVDGNIYIFELYDDDKYTLDDYSRAIDLAKFEE